MDGKGEIEDSENVVRLPRDWVGPPEELVPIGARARARARESQLRPGESQLREADAETESAAERCEGVPAAADFWDEGSANLHHAIQGPADEPDLTNAEAPVSSPTGGMSRPRRRARNRRALSRGTALGVGSALVVAVVITVVMVLHSGGAPRGAPPAAAGSGSLVHFEKFRSAVRAGITGIGAQIRHDTRIARTRLARQRQAVADRHVRHATELDISEIRRRRAAATARASAGRSTSSAEPPVTTAESTLVSETPVTPPAEASTTPTTTAPAATTSSPSTSTGSDSGTHRAFGVGGYLGAGHPTGG